LLFLQGSKWTNNHPPSRPLPAPLTSPSDSDSAVNWGAFACPVKSRGEGEAI
jgi:hypothetical protein